MKDLKSIRREVAKVADAAQAVPTLSYNLIRHGLLPFLPSVYQSVKQESLKDVPLTEIGKFFARFLSHSGPVLIKFGQILATRSDILPAKICHELEALYDQQPAMPRSELKKILEKRFGKEPPFKLQGKKPLAVGSIGEVHRAKLKEGTEIVIKVIRPGILRRIERDIHFIETVMDLVNIRFQLWDRRFEHGFRRALEELTKQLKAEADLRVEAAALKDFRRRFRKNPKVYVPYCYDKFSDKNILVMEEVQGEPLSKVRVRAKRNKKLAKQLAELAITEILRQIFEEGRFHADPHGGNLLLMPDGRLGIIDLGLTGEFGEKERKRLVKAIRAFLAKDADAVIAALLEFGEVPEDFNKEKFRKEIQNVVNKHKGRVATEIQGKKQRTRSKTRKKTSKETIDQANSLEIFVQDLFRVAYKHHIYVPQNSVLLIKTLVTIEGLARSIDPELNLIEQAIPVVLRAMLPKWLRWPAHFTLHRAKMQ